MTDQATSTIAFYDRPQVRRELISLGAGAPQVQLGIEPVSNPQVGLGGAYGAWGKNYDNEELRALVEERLGGPLPPEEVLNLAELGFVSRHHVQGLTEEENRRVEVEVGARFLRTAAETCGWQPGEVEGVLLGLSAPPSPDYTEEIAARAGIPSSAITVSVHKACDGSVGGLHLALNPEMSERYGLSRNLAQALQGKKVLVGGIESLSRFVAISGDTNALQLFGNAAGVIGLIPGRTMKFLVGRAREVFDTEGVLQVKMAYPASAAGLVSVVQSAAQRFRITGLQHEPDDGSTIKMAGPMGMVKLFVRTGVQVVQEVYLAYQERLEQMGLTGKEIAVAIVHHANYKINRLKEKNLLKEGISIPMPWVVSDFGNVSAASNMIAFLRQLPQLHTGDHVMLDGFGAGTYYDTLVVEIGAA